MGRFSKITNRLKGKKAPGSESNGGGKVSSPPLPSVSASTPLGAHRSPSPSASLPVPVPLDAPFASPNPDTSAPPEEPDTVSTPTPHDLDVNVEVDPWERAYGILQKREPELLEDYTTHLASLQGETSTDPHLATPRSVESTVKRLLEDRDKKQWRVSLLGKDIKIREQAEKLAKFFIWSDPVVKHALSTQPYAALAWSGVSLLLPLLTSGSVHNGAMLAGFNRVCDRQMYWKVCEEDYLQSENRQHYQRLVGPLAKFYSYIIEYQARVICHLSKAQLSRAWENVAGWNAWDNATVFEALDRDCEGYVDHLGKEETRVRWERQIQEIQQSREILDEIYNALAEVKEQNQTIYTDQMETALLHGLVSNYEGYKNFNPQRVKGTCEWFLNDDRFLTWRDSDKSRLLWVSADPGCGKSVLSRTLVDEHLLSTKTTSNVCYFFFKDGDKGRMSSHDALSAILHQLFTQDCTGRLLSHALPSHRSFGDGLARNFSKMWRILVECAESPDTGEIICVLDALDECEKESRNELFMNLRDLYLSSSSSSSRSPSKLKFLITSRPYDYLEAPFKMFLKDCDAYLRFDGNEKSRDVGEEINLVIDARIPAITGGFTEEHRGWIRERLRSMEHRTYLWLHLIFNIIEESPCEYGRLDDVETLLSELPSEVSEAYETILSRSKNKRQTEALLGIVLAAEYPLRLEEVNVALTVALKKTPFESVTSFESHLWPEGNFESVVRNLCGLFVSVYDEKLYLIHQTAREFLIHVSPKRQGSWEGRLGMEKAHSTMSVACLHYLLLPDLALYGRGRNKKSSFIHYAAPHWPLHFVSQEEKIANDSVKHARLLCMTGKHAPGHAWEQELYHLRRVQHFSLLTDLGVASHLKLRLVVEDMLAEGKTDVNARGGGHLRRTPLIGRTPLIAAASQGNNDIIQILLDNGAEVDARDSAGMTPLHEAGNEELVQILLRWGADVNSKDSASDTPLHEASFCGRVETVRILLDNGADVNIRNKDGETALDLARDNPEIQQMLIERGAERGEDVESENGNGQTPLFSAVSTSSKVSIRTGSVASFDVMVSN